MKLQGIGCLAALLTAAACEPSGIAGPAADAAMDVPTTTTIAWRGDGTEESPYFYVEPADEWATTFSFEESTPMYEGEAAPCPPMYRNTLWMWINIASVGRRRFYFQGPFNWVRTIAPGYAVYSIVVPRVDERGEWTASGPVVAECRRGLLPGLGMIRLTDHLGQLRRNGINAGGDDGCGGDGGGGYYFDDPIIILLAPDADASVLTQAVEALMVVRRQSGDDGSGVNATFRARRPQQQPRVLPWAARVLRDVRSAAPREVPGVGRIPAVQIWLPTQRGVGGVGRSGNP